MIDLNQYRSLDGSPAFLIYVRLFDELSLPASLTRDPVPEWRLTAKAKSSASTPTDVYANEKAVGRSGVWVAGIGSTKPFAWFSGPMLERKERGTGAMPTGLFKTLDQSVQVDYDGVSIPIPRSTYENNGYKPDFGNLPLEPNIGRQRTGWITSEALKASSAPTDV